MNNFISCFAKFISGCFVSCFTRCFPVLLAFLFSCPVYSQWVNSSVSGNIVNAYSLLKTESGKVFSVSNMGILASTDFGDSWRYSSFGITNENNIRCVAGNDTVLFAGCYMDGLFRSSDGGYNWVNVPLNSNYYNTVNCVLVKGNQVFAGTGSGIYKSTNYGVNWSLCFQGLNYYSTFMSIVKHNQFIIALGKSGSMGKLYRSSNDGLSWDSVNSGMQYFGLDYLQSCNNNVYLAGVGFYASTNNGDVFTFYAGGCGVSFNFLSKSDGYITSGNYSTAMLIPSCGFYFTNYGLADKIVNDFVISYPNFTGTDKGFYKSTNAGASWFYSFSGYLTKDYKGVGTYGTLVITSNSTSGKIFKKELGQQWTTSTGSYGMNKPHRYFYNMQNMFAFSEDVLIKSPLSSYTYWYGVNIPSLTPKKFDVCDNFIAASNANRVIYKSINEGNNWSVLPNSGLPANYSSIHSLTITQSGAILLGVIAANSSFELYKLAFNGTVWNKITVSNVTGFKTDVIRSFAGSLYAASGSGVFTSTNDGLNWFANGQGLPNDSVSDFAFVNNMVFCSSRNNGVFRYLSQSNAWTGYNTGLGNLKVNALSGILRICMRRLIQVFIMLM